MEQSNAGKRDQSDQLLVGIEPTVTEAVCEKALDHYAVYPRLLEATWFGRLTISKMLRDPLSSCAARQPPAFEQLEYC